MSSSQSIDCWRDQPRRVHPGVDDQPRGAPRLRVEHPEPLGRRPVQPELVGQALGVQAPALDEGAARGPRAEPAEHVEARVLHLEADLEVVARDGLVERRRGELRVGPARQVVGVDVVDAGARAVDRRREVVRERRVLLLERLDRADLAGGAREAAEHARRDLGGPADVLRGAGDERLRRRRLVGEVGRRACAGRRAGRRRSPRRRRSPAARRRSSASSSSPTWWTSSGSRSSDVQRRIAVAVERRRRRAPRRGRAPRGSPRSTSPGAPRGSAGRPGRRPRARRRGPARGPRRWPPAPSPGRSPARSGSRGAARSCSIVRSATIRAAVRPERRPSAMMSRWASMYGPYAAEPRQERLEALGRVGGLELRQLRRAPSAGPWIWSTTWTSR